MSTQFAAVVRWLHIYLSLLGFTALTFFAATGITLNHPTWFGADAQRTTELQGELKREWLHQAPRPAATADENLPPAADLSEVARLEVVEYLRQEHALRGAVSEFRVDEQECLVLFKGPGYSADVVINRETAQYTVTQTALGAVAILNDLHKGRDSGASWSMLIDVTAVLMVLVSVTGFVLIFYLRRRRLSGILTAVVGTLALIAIYLWLVP